VELRGVLRLWELLARGGEVEAGERPERGGEVEGEPGDAVFVS